MYPFQYLVPALFLNITVYEVVSYGNLSTGGTLGLGKVKGGTLYSEPGFEPHFTAEVLYATDYVRGDPGDDNITRPDLTATLVPDDNTVPFQIRASGVPVATPEVAAIVASNTSEGLAIPYGGIHSIFTPTFYGGDEKYKVLQNSIFVGTETVSDGGVPGEFLVGIKISKVFPVKTNITIGHEFP